MSDGTDGEGGAVEKVTLRDVTQHGGFLVLEDGRSLRVQSAIHLQRFSGCRRRGLRFPKIMAAWRSL